MKTITSIVLKEEGERGRDGWLIAGEVGSSPNFVRTGSLLDKSVHPLSTNSARCY